MKKSQRIKIEKPVASKDEILSLREFALMVGASTATIRHHAKKGRIPMIAVPVFKFPSWFVKDAQELIVRDRGIGSPTHIKNQREAKRL